MEEIFIHCRNLITRFLYKNISRKIFFRIDPETTHERIIRLGRFLGSNVFTRKCAAFLFSYSNPKLEQEILGIKFKNPVGLAAGFDKDAKLTDILPSVGFGFAEVGSITGEPCQGNPKPRLWRLPKSKALVVYYGLKNEGCEKIAKKLGKKNFAIPLGISVAKTNSPETVDIQAGTGDYVKACGKFINIGSYLTINISCPNTFGGEPFTEAGSLDLLLGEIKKLGIAKPIFLKLPPDLGPENIDKIIEVARKHRVSGFICANLTKNRKNLKILDKEVPELGGISGKAVEDLSNQLIGYIYRRTKKEFVIIGCGGVFSAQDAYKKIKLGASLVQLITGMIFEGPQLISEINQGLARLLDKDGFQNISQAIGADNTTT